MRPSVKSMAIFGNGSNKPILKEGRFGIEVNIITVSITYLSP